MCQSAMSIYLDPGRKLSKSLPERNGDQILYICNQTSRLTNSCLIQKQSWLYRRELKHWSGMAENERAR